MDSIFEEDADAVGGEIEAYCPSPRCKADTTHTIISMYEDEVRRVQCVVCGEVHAYRKPRGDGEGGEDGGRLEGAREAVELGRSDGPRERQRAEQRSAVLDPRQLRRRRRRAASDVRCRLCRRAAARQLRRDGVPRRARAEAFHPQPRRRVRRADARDRRDPDPARGQEEEAHQESRDPGRADPGAQQGRGRSRVTRARNAAQNRMDEASRNADEHNKKLKADAKKLPKPKAVPSRCEGAAKPAPRRQGNAGLQARQAAKAAKPPRPLRRSRPRPLRRSPPSRCEEARQGRCEEAAPRPPRSLRRLQEGREEAAPRRRRSANRAAPAARAADPIRRAVTT